MDLLIVLIMGSRIINRCIKDISRLNDFFVSRQLKVACFFIYYTAFR